LGVKQVEAAGAETVRALKELVRMLLPEERSTIERLAPRLGLSNRTLQRRPRARVISFEDIVDDTRREIAIERISAEMGTITEDLFCSNTPIVRFHPRLSALDWKVPKRIRGIRQARVSQHQAPETDGALEEFKL